MKRQVWILAALALTGCGFGRVEQGRVVEYDSGKRVVRLVRDSNYQQPGKPRFDVLPPETVALPTDPNEMGPAPDAGRLLAIDREGRRLITFDPSSGALCAIPYTPLTERANVRSGDAYPIIDREKKTITAYDPASRILLTFAATDEQLALPAETWKAGDEVRYYFKQPGQALRLMNVTRTDVRKSGH